MGTVIHTSAVANNKVIALQMTSTPDRIENVQSVEACLSSIQFDKHNLVVLPECWACFGGHESTQSDIAEVLDDPNGVLQAHMSQWARQFNTWLIGGTVPIKAPSGKYWAATLVYNPQGERVQQYNKLHLFDVDVADNTGTYRESDATEAGQHVVVVDMGFAKVGIAVCYDVRFPELFRVMQAQGADLICLPSAFTQVTGQAHWSTLIKARAIENQCYMLAANQVGTHENGRHTFGHSMLVDGWGNIVDVNPQRIGIAEGAIDLQALRAIRVKMPTLKHRRMHIHSDTNI